MCASRLGCHHRQSSGYRICRLNKTVQSCSQTDAQCSSYCRGRGEARASCELPEGEIRLNLLAKTAFGLKEGAGLVHGAPLSVVNRSEQVIRKAIKRKYRQARNVEMPVLVAIKAEGFFRHLEDFDTA